MLTPEVAGREPFLFIFNRTPLKVVKSNLRVDEALFRKEPAFYLPLSDARSRFADSWISDVIRACEGLLVGDRQYTYFEMKVQHFEVGQVPSLDYLWHLDGTTRVASKYTGLPFTTLDLYSRAKLPVYPRMVSCFFGSPSRTQYLMREFALSVPQLLCSWQELNEDAAFQRELDKSSVFIQSPNEIVAFDAFHLHRAVPATERGWRCWFRFTETNTRRLDFNPPSEVVYGFK